MACLAGPALDGGRKGLRLMAVTLATGTAQGSNCATQTPLYPTTGSYAFSKDDPGESIYTNIAGALDQPNSIRTGAKVVPDIFKGVPLIPAAGQRTDGLSLVVQVRETWKLDDAADTVAPLYVPASAHMVLQIPTDALVTPTVVGALMLRLFGAPFRNGTDTIAQAITSLVHGITRF